MVTLDYISEGVAEVISQVRHYSPLLVDFPLTCHRRVRVSRLMIPCFSHADSSAARRDQRPGQFGTVVRGRCGGDIGKYCLGNNALPMGARYNAPLIYVCMGPI